MAVHIFRAGLAGRLLFPRAILSDASFRSTGISLWIKKEKEEKERDEFVSRECSTKHLSAGREDDEQIAGEYHHT